MKDLKGRLALVTGAAMGMGKDLSAKLLLEGCRVALVDVNAKELSRTEAELSRAGECKSYACDVSDRKAVYALAKRVAKEMGPVAILVNNAGIVRARELLDLDDEAIEKTISINLTAQFWTCRAFLPAMVEKKEGHVVNVASAGGILAIPNLTAYCASKFGVVGFSDALRQEMRKRKLGVGVTYVCPNTVNTGMFEGSKMVAGTKMLSSDEVTARIVKAIKNNTAMVAVPNVSVKFLTPLTKLLLPIKAMDWLNATLGMDTCNDSWKGRSC
ncbi:MAG: SDR family oxidoreductase [Spirochaetota bacterium]|jgi:all-trans-retinol dehydrogenase (NAD+)